MYCFYDKTVANKYQKHMKGEGVSAMCLRIGHASAAVPVRIVSCEPRCVGNVAWTCSKRIIILQGWHKPQHATTNDSLTLQI